MIKSTFLTLALGLALMACNKPEQEQAAKANGDTPQLTAGNVTQTTIKVPTIQCGSCVSHVEEALKGVDGVSTIKVNLETKIAEVNFDPVKTNLAAMEKAISMAGYDANDTKSDPAAYAELDACCKIPESHSGK
ncbi:MAG: hypothetical protein ALAOOOJD_03878 [bacterium]|nr:hypothetical protein [bacterium]